MASPKTRENLSWNSKTEEGCSGAWNSAKARRVEELRTVAKV
jgi:hypothetical protein